MSIDQYLEFVAARLRDAQGKSNRDEVIRLLRLVVETCTEKIAEIERPVTPT